MDYIFLIITALCTGGSYIVNGLFSKKCKYPDPFVNTVFSSITVAMFFWTYNGFRFTFDITTILLATVFALAFATSCICMILAFKCGETSLTALLISYSLLLPTFFGIIFFGDRPGAFFYVGLVLLACSIVLINRKKKVLATPESEIGEDVQISTLKPKRRIKYLWIIFTIAALIANGACSIIQSYQQRLQDGGYKAEFMIMAMLIVIIFMLPLIIIRRKNLKEKIKYGLPFGILTGIMVAIINLMVMLLVSAEQLPVSVIFPLIAGGGLLVTYILSFIIFKEKLSLWQNVGFFLGLLSIVFFNLKQ